MTKNADHGQRVELLKKLDLEGFNKRDWALFASYYTDDVVVEFNDERIRGLEVYVDVLRQVCTQMPDIRIVPHLVVFGEAEWTCAMSRVENMGKPEIKRVSVARWRGDQICEEYIFMR